MENGEDDSSQLLLKAWEKVPKTIGFRLDDEHRMALAERAKALNCSVHDLARHYVIHILHENDERQQLITAIVALREELLEARKDIKVSTQELLVATGRPIEEARGWIRKNFPK